MTYPTNTLPLSEQWASDCDDEYDLLIGFPKQNLCEICTTRGERVYLANCRFGHDCTDPDIRCVGFDGRGRALRRLG